MGNNINRIGALVALAALGATLMAQPGGGPGGPPHHPPTPAVLLHMNSVKVEIKITAEQQAKLDDLFSRLGPGNRGGGDRIDLREELRKILNQDQGRRLHQLVLQFDSPFSLVHPETGRQLKLTREQADKIHEIIRATLPRPERGQRPDWNEMQRLKALATQKAMNVLNAAQKQEWAKMTGKVFTNWEEPTRPGGGGNRP